MSTIATHPNIQIIEQPEPKTSPSTGTNATKKQPVVPVFQAQPPPNYPPATATETQRNMIESKLVKNDQNETVLQIMYGGQVVTEIKEAAGLLITITSGGTTDGVTQYTITFANGTSIHVPVNSP